MRLARLAMLAAALVTCVAAAPAPRRNWNATVAVTPAGSHVLGNPAAAVKLVEYISYTCPHCAHFDQEADGAIRIAYVAPGKVSVEVRHLVRDPVDLTVAMLTNCGDPSRFFLRHAAFLRSQDQWIGAANTASEAQRSRWTTGDEASRNRAVASDFGFYAIMERFGYQRVAVDRCLADSALRNRLAAQTAEGARLGVNGTPSFMLNGVMLAGTHDWNSLRAQLEARF